MHQTRARIIVTNRKHSGPGSLRAVDPGDPVNAEIRARSSFDPFNSSPRSPGGGAVEIRGTGRAPVKDCVFTGKSSTRGGGDFAIGGDHADNATRVEPCQVPRPAIVRDNLSHDGEKAADLRFPTERLSRTHP